VAFLIDNAGHGAGPLGSRVGAIPGDERPVPGMPDPYKDTNVLNADTLWPLPPQAIEYYCPQGDEHWRGSKQCGPNTLFAYLQLQGIEVDRVELANRVTMAEVGTNIEELRRVAEAEGVPSAVVSCSPDSLDSLPTPCILHLLGDNGHYVLLLGESTRYEDSLVIADLTRCEVREHSKGVIARIASGYALVPRRGLSTGRSATYWGMVTFLVTGAFGYFMLVRRQVSVACSDD
jgi:hypothetical protein